MKNTDHRYVRYLADICADKGMRHAVFSPGSRCAPLVMAFHRHPHIQCHVIVDERCAAFYALGIAQQTRQPVALICTSGTATLNYAPALAEAFYQEVPLLVLTADRPAEWIDQADMQSIRQVGVYANYIRKSFQLPHHSPPQADDLWYACRLVNEAFNVSLYPTAAPVHINVPLREPLYDETDTSTDNYIPKRIDLEGGERVLRFPQHAYLWDLWHNSPKKMLLAGLLPPDARLLRLLRTLQRREDMVLLCESTSNLNDDAFFSNTDRLIDGCNEQQQQYLQPDLLVSFGGMIVSKKIKQFLRKHPPKHHILLHENAAHHDTFQLLTQIVAVPPQAFFSFILEGSKKISRTDTAQPYYHFFQHINHRHRLRQQQYLKQIPFCDLKIFDVLWQYLPKNALLQLGNSTPVRYSNIFGLRGQQSAYGNRGVGGIDGTTSTAAGAAIADTQARLTVLITGDLAFFYDSNALWNEELSPNLRIILINNGGGSIFRIIPGPDHLPPNELQRYFDTPHHLNAEPLAQLYHLEYAACSNEKQLKQALPSFFGKSDRAKILEIKSDKVLSAEVLRNYFRCFQ